MIYSSLVFNEKAERQISLNSLGFRKALDIPGGRTALFMLF